MIARGRERRVRRKAGASSSAEQLAKAIAPALHLSVRTVESHVRHVLAKAGLSNRTQLAAWAREHVQ